MKVQGRNIDVPLFILSVVMTLLGCLAIFDAGFARSLQSGSSAVPPEFKSQALFSIVAFLIGFGLSVWSARDWRRYINLSLIIILGLLLLVEVVGTTMNGATRWLKIGPITLQPAEFAKVTSILFLANILANREPFKLKGRAPKDWAERLDKEWVPRLLRLWPAALLGLVVFLIEKEPDLGTGAVVAASCFGLGWFGKASRFSMVLITVVGLLAVSAMVVKEPYRMERITSHFHRWEDHNVDDIGYQTTQSETAMASGGLIGAGIGAGRAKHMLPAATTDFVLATVAEETGLVGMLLVLTLMGTIVWRLLIMARQSATEFGKYFCAGTAIWLAVQATTNVVMANGMLPPIGIPFPFISSGGSSLIALWMAIGLCQSAYSQSPQEESEYAPRRHRRRNRRSRLSRA